ncbi:hypothetical protein [Rhizobium mayense]|uniref:Mu-like prophage FluMu N-terminal domain-containing protein n=1 Tax=Rhizobium mayense TaxID=1312184 RepID=A0ABT7JY31_9HYPH|nr:hypothetical protein [Rhizobium mayense]MDL2401256.1 hypothetical protein [Rhizobium mayense]
MTKIAIICTSPGMLRHGVRHPDREVYDEGRWTEEQLAAFKADPSFQVVEMDDEEVADLSQSMDFKVAVAAEVKRQVEAKSAELQKSFNKSVADAAKERTKELSAQLESANVKVTELQAKVDASAAGAGAGSQ